MDTFITNSTMNNKDVRDNLLLQVHAQGFNHLFSFIQNHQILISMHHSKRPLLSEVTYLLLYSYTIALSSLFELYTRGGCLNHTAKPSGLNVHLKRTIQ